MLLRSGVLFGWQFAEPEHHFVAISLRQPLPRRDHQHLAREARVRLPPCLQHQRSGSRADLRSHRPEGRPQPLPQVLGTQAYANLSGKEAVHRSCFCQVRPLSARMHIAWLEPNHKADG